MMNVADLGRLTLQQQPIAPDLSLSLLGQMLQHQDNLYSPRAFMREINPGVTWGGRDKNAIQPNDVMQSRTYVQPPEGM